MTERPLATTNRASTLGSGVRGDAAWSRGYRGSRLVAPDRNGWPNAPMTPLPLRVSLSRHGVSGQNRPPTAVARLPCQWLKELRRPSQRGRKLQTPGDQAL